MNLIKLLVYSNIWIALAVSFFTWQSYILLNLKENWIILGLVFFSTLFAYNFQRLVKLGKIEYTYNPRTQWIKENSVFLFILSGISLVASIVLGLMLSYKELFYLGGLSLISIFYAQSFLKSKQFSLRDIPGLKIYLIAFVWAGTALLPIVNQFEFTLSTLLLFLEKFIFILAITIPFDIRDLKFDKVKLKTIPQLIGVNGAKVLSVLLMFVYLALLIKNYEVEGYKSILIFLPIALFGIILSNKKRPELYYTGLLDGLIVLQGILVVVEHNI